MALWGDEDDPYSCEADGNGQALCAEYAVWCTDCKTARCYDHPCPHMTPVWPSLPAGADVRIEVTGFAGPQLVQCAECDAIHPAPECGPDGL